MNRLTAERCNGIKSGYWSSAKKEDLVQALGAYEDTGLTPEEILKGRSLVRWIPADKRIPEDTGNYLVTLVTHGKKPWVSYLHWDADDHDCTKETGDQDIEVVAWMPLPEPYKKERE